MYSCCWDIAAQIAMLRWLIRAAHAFPFTCIHPVLCCPRVIVDKAKGDDKVEADDVAIPMDQTQDASKLGRQVAPGESSSSSSSSSSDDQAEHVYSGMHSPASSCCSHSSLPCGLMLLCHVATLLAGLCGAVTCRIGCLEQQQPCTASCYWSM